MLLIQKELTDLCGFDRAIGLNCEDLRIFVPQLSLDWYARVFLSP